MHKTRTTLLAATGAVAALALSGCGLLGGGNVATADAGDCMLREDLESDQVFDLPTVDCTEEHEAQVIYTFDATGEDGDSVPADLEDQAAAECMGDPFTDFVGTDYQSSSLGVGWVLPTNETWPTGDREVICIAFTAGGETTTESFEGSGL